MNMNTDALNTVTGWYSSLELLSLGSIVLKRNRVAIPTATVVKNFPVIHLSALLLYRSKFLGSVHFLESQLFHIRLWSA
jgi:hypothetical protein